MIAKLPAYWIIYCHTLVVDGRRYVGQTKGAMDRRWAAHVREARSPKWSVNTFANAIRRFGPKAFTREELEVCFSQWDANKAEVRWVEKFNTTDPLLGFNTQRGGTRAVRRSRAKPPTRPVDVERPESARPATTSSFDANDVAAMEDDGYVILDGGQPVCLDDILATAAEEER